MSGRRMRIFDISRNSNHTVRLPEARSPLESAMLNEITSRVFLLNRPSRDSGGRRVSEAPQQTGIIQEETTPDTIPTFKVEGDIGECGICFETFQLGENFRRLPCSETVNHLYHNECIDPWLGENNTCPLCRSIISTRNFSVGSASSPQPSSLHWPPHVLDMMRQGNPIAYLRSRGSQ
jgi:hypothetical protein